MIVQRSSTRSVSSSSRWGTKQVRQEELERRGASVAAQSASDLSQCEGFEHSLAPCECDWAWWHAWLNQEFLLTCVDILQVHIDRGFPRGVTHNLIDRLIRIKTTTTCYMRRMLFLYVVTGENNLKGTMLFEGSCFVFPGLQFYFYSRLFILCVRNLHEYFIRFNLSAIWTKSLSIVLYDLFDGCSACVCVCELWPFTSAAE